MSGPKKSYCVLYAVWRHFATVVFLGEDSSQACRGVPEEMTNDGVQGVEESYVKVMVRSNLQHTISSRNCGSTTCDPLIIDSSVLAPDSHPVHLFSGYDVTKQSAAGLGSEFLKALHGPGKNRDQGSLVLLPHITLR